MMWALVILRALWTLPTTAIGLLVGGLCTPLGTRWRWVGGVLECYGGAVAWLLEHATVLEGGVTAMTLGDVILGRSPAALDVCRAHEHVHVRQCHRWGPLFLPAYLLASAYMWLRGRRGYRDNPFEAEAYAVSEGSQDRLR